VASRFVQDRRTQQQANLLDYLVLSDVFIRLSKRFKEEREEVENDHRSGRPSTSRTEENVQHVTEKVQSDRRLTVRMIAEELDMNSERV